MYGGADLSTVDANPSVYSYGDTSTTDQISQLANVAGQWGTAIASIVSGNPVSAVQTPGGIRTIGAAGSTYRAPGMLGSNTGILLLLGGGILLFLLLRK
jgi:hypothetical protein